MERGLERARARVRLAVESDVAAMTELINAAFAVEVGNFKDRLRTDEKDVRERMSRERFFVLDGKSGRAEASEESGRDAGASDDASESKRSAGANVTADAQMELAACVYVEMRPEKTAYFGLLSIDPALQGRGLGRMMTEYAEDWAREQGCRWMMLRYVSLREDLRRIYEHMGYEETTREDATHYPGFTRAAEFVNMRKAL
jgi:GNAT superfamily N-acetyltransferase